MNRVNNWSNNQNGHKTEWPDVDIGINGIKLIMTKWDKNEMMLINKDEPTFRQK